MAAPGRVIFKHSTSFIAKCVREANLKGVSRIKVEFDPFHKRAESAREVLFMLSSDRIRRTNFDCSLRSDVKSDLSNPVIKVDMADGKKVEYQCQHLSSAEILEHFNEYCRMNVPDKS